ncbi:MAG: DUF4038 domain-containing protein [Gammaproteobacteria bacterium]|nr:DUF4038 domain-containing protein [Gammaproteobacteria bacterium]
MRRLAAGLFAMALAASMAAAEFPLTVSPDGRYLTDAAGAPFLFVGDTHWPLLWHYSFDEAREIIDDRAAKGFTVMLLSVGAFSDRPNAQGHRSFSDRAKLTPIEEYFTHADRVLDHIESRGMATYAVALWWNQFNRQATVEGIGEYGRWLGERWADRANVLWVIGGDTPYRESDLASYRALANGIRAGGGEQLMSWHPHGGGPMRSAGHSSSEYLHDEPWLDFSSVQGHAEGGRMAARVLEDYRRTPAKPVLMVEPWYYWTELKDPRFGFPIHAPELRIRQSMYQTRLGGGSMGEGHGAWPLWFHDSTEAQWRAALRQKSATHIGTHMTNLLRQVEWWKLEPDTGGQLLTAGAGNPNGWDRTVAAGASDRSFALIYVAGQTELAIDATWFHGPVQATWHDPTNGSMQPAQATNANGELTFTSPNPNYEGDEDFVLLLTTSD